MRVRLIALIFVLGLQAAAQNTSASNVFDTQTAIVSHSPRVVAFTPAKEVKPRVFDRKFIVLAGIATAATMLDIATTSHCMSTYADCQEGNPLLGSHPSTAKLYGVSFSMAPNGKLWMMPPIIASAGHGLAAVLNV